MIKNFETVMAALSGSGPVTAQIEFSNYEDIFIRPDVLIDLLKGKKVVHLGCTDHIQLIDYKIREGQFLHNLITCVSKKCIGIDIDTAAIQKLKEYGITNVCYGNIEKGSIKEIKEDKWDYLLMGEVLEHTDNPVLFLKRIRENYKDYIDKAIITVPNAFGLPFLSNAYGKGLEEVNSDHRYWFTPYTLLKVAHRAGLGFIDLIMCIYENSKNLIYFNKDTFKQKPLLMDTIILVCKL